MSGRSYAGVVNLLGKNTNAIRSKGEILLQMSGEIGLEVKIYG